MRLLGSGGGSPLSKLLPWMVALSVVLLFGAGTIWTRQQDQRVRSAEAARDEAQAQLVQVQASLTAIARAQAVASATASALAAEPGASLQRALGLVFAAYQEPSDGRVRALMDAFSTQALTVFRPELDRLTSQGLHLAGSSTFSVQVVDTTPQGSDRAVVRTKERWVYDELSNQTNARVRCLQEDSEQTYILRRMPAASGWVVESVELGPSSRSDC